MPAKNFLKIDQKDKLQKALKKIDILIFEKEFWYIFITEWRKKLKRKLLIFLGYSLKEVSYWCVKVDPENLESLLDERIKGNYQKNNI